MREAERFFILKIEPLAEIEQLKPGLMREAERFFILQQIDSLWREH